jgi:hypothetical protein
MKRFLLTCSLLTGFHHAGSPLVTLQNHVEDYKSVYGKVLTAAAFGGVAYTVLTHKKIATLSVQEALPIVDIKAVITHTLVKNPEAVLLKLKGIVDPVLQKELRIFIATEFPEIRLVFAPATESVASILQDRLSYTPLAPIATLSAIGGADAVLISNISSKNCGICNWRIEIDSTPIEITPEIIMSEEDEEDYPSTTPSPGELLEEPLAPQDLRRLLAENESLELIRRIRELKIKEFELEVADLKERLKETPISIEKNRILSQITDLRVMIRHVGPGTLVIFDLDGVVFLQDTNVLIDSAFEEILIAIREKGGRIAVCTARMRTAQQETIEALKPFGIEEKDIMITNSGAKAHVINSYLNGKDVASVLFVDDQLVNSINVLQQVSTLLVRSLFYNSTKKHAPLTLPELIEANLLAQCLEN